MRENGGRHQYGRWEGATALTIGHFSRFNRSPSASNGSRIGYETEACSPSSLSCGSALLSLHLTLSSLPLFVHFVFV